MGFYLEIITPDKKFVSEEADKIVCPGEAGVFCVLPGHAPMLSLLKLGELRYVDSTRSNEHFMVVTGGYVEVTQDKVSVLADECVRPRDIILSQAEADMAKAEEKLKTVDKDTEAYRKAKWNLDYAQAVVKLGQKLQ
ncbi:MAG: ATP synthase F1 subunit epsilon [Deltaproteobacteria bacterium]|nr:ATP synthase F1 subunit epsilon [Candidatus Zymogenaceae bacterium]